MFVCAREEKLTGEVGRVAKERSLLLRKEMSSGSFEKSRLELVGTLQGHSSGVNGVSFSPDGTRLIVVLDSGYRITRDIPGCAFTQEALPDPEGGPDTIMASATRDAVRHAVGFGRLKLRFANDCAVSAKGHKVHIFKLMR